MQHLLVSMIDNENSKFAFLLAICGIHVYLHVYGDQYSRKLKAENDCGNQVDRFGLYHTQH